MWPFKDKKKKNADVPAEIKDYYQAEKREKRGMAWLLAVGTLLATVLVVLGLFFGGRWAYKKITAKKTKPTQTAEVKQGNQSPQTPAKPQTAPKKPDAKPATPSPSPAPSATAPQSTQPVTPHSNPTPPSAPATSTTPAPANALPNTGPTGND